MADYKKLYHRMFNAATDADRELLKAENLLRQALQGLREAQRECEEQYLAMDIGRDAREEQAEKEPPP